MWAEGSEAGDVQQTQATQRDGAFQAIRLP